MQAMPEVSLGRFLRRTTDEVILDAKSTYATVGILSYGRGLFKRPPVTGAGTKYKSYFRIKEGEFIYSKLFAWEGALAVVPPEFDGMYVSQEFPTFEIDDTIASTAYVSLLCEWEPMWQRVRTVEAGLGGRRKRVHLASLLRLTTPLPPLAAQRRIADLIGKISDALAAATQVATLTERARTAIRRELLSVNKSEWRPLGDLATIEAKLVDPKETRYQSMPHIGIDRIEARTGRLLDLNTARQDAITGGKYLFGRENVLYSKLRPELRKAAFPAIEGLCSTDIYPLRPSPGLDPEFLLEVLLSDAFSNETTARSAGTKMPRIGREGLLTIGVPAPQFAQQLQIRQLLAAFKESRQASLGTAELIRRLRVTLMSRLLSEADQISDSYDRLLAAVG